MRILLVEPPVSKNDIGTGIVGLAEPLALECVASGAAGHDVRILDMRVCPDFDREMESFRPHVVGTTCYTPGVHSALKLLEEAKKHDPRVFTVAGGHHATVQPGDFNSEAVDAVAVGEGEETFGELADALDRGRPVGDIPGLALKDGAGLRFTAERPLMDLETAPFPARHLVEKYRMNYFRASWRPITSMYTTRGCPYRCVFCSMWKVHRGKCRMRSAQSIVEELKTIPGKYIDLVDDNSFIDIGRSRELCGMIEREGIKKVYKVYARADTVVKHPELIRRWKNIGMELILIGFEAFRDAELERWNKKNTVRENEQAFAVLRDLGVEAAAYFVVDPGYTSADFRELSDYIDRNGLSHPVFTILTPFPGTELYRERRHEIKSDYELFDFYHAVLPTKLPPREFYKNFVYLYKRAYSTRKVLGMLKRRGRTAAFSPGQVKMKFRFMKQLDGLVKNAERF